MAKGGLLIFDHPFADPQRKFRDIDFEKAKELVMICNMYKGRIALEWNSYCLPWVRKLLSGYSDVNSKIERLGEELKIPVVSTTDLHARNRRLLMAMGTSFVEIPFANIDLSKPLLSLKRNILSSNFKVRKRYVSFLHFVEAFGIPILFD